MTELNTDALAAALERIAKLIDASESDPFVMLDTVREIEQVARTGVAAFNGRNFPGRA